ncbi:MAG: PAS domain S-box protein [Desulfoprunum sp.]|nr:PAS domain S-box protein [Desulfoprunum sp.]
MVKPSSGREAEALKLFQHRSRLLTAIREHSLGDPQAQSSKFIFQNCCTVLHEALHCNSVWIGNLDREKSQFILYASSPTARPGDSLLQNALAEVLIERFNNDFTSFNEPLYLHIDLDRFGVKGAGDGSYLVWPVGYQGRTYGFVAVNYPGKGHISELRKEFLAHVIDDIWLALFSRDMALKFHDELDFNKEIINTIQELIVTIRPCGTIASFNKKAEQVTGYGEQEILEKYWVDVLISPKKRREFQQLFSEILKGEQASIHFKAPLLTRDGTERFINWHGSIRHNIEKGKVGLVMLGIDETETLAADQQLNMFTARWKKIFIAIQDPALVVANDKTILEANPATCAAAKKHRDEVIGKKVCDILHGGHSGGEQCPLEQFIGYQKTQISETELNGLHGTYMLTVSPLLEENGEINATLLVARNLTEEEAIRAEAIRAAHLAAIGELASGVAHEINNPINGIINYAQIILDDPHDPDANENLGNIISEGKRIAGIVSKLLDFARRREEAHAPSRIETIVANSLHLVAHLLKKDGIVCSVNIAQPLPSLLCNEQQLQQVVLNIISNARYALNMRYPQPCAEKKLEIKGEVSRQEEKDFIRLTFTDQGIGIEPEIQKRLFDPFFSTKPKGEGTGLGLSISHGLVREHGGTIKVQSKKGEWARFIIDLPVRSCKEL